MIVQLLTAAALLAVPAPAPAPATCMTVAEAGDVGMVFTAASVSGIAQSCGPTLPPTAFLRSEAGTSYIHRLQADASERRARAIAALDRVLAGRMPSGLTAEMMLSTLSHPPADSQATVPMMTATCSSMSRLIEAVSPLPSENVVMAFTAIVDMAVAVGPLVKATEARQRAAGRPAPDEMPDLSRVFCSR